MKIQNLLFGIIFFSCNILAQGSISVNQIDSLYQNVIQDSAKLKKNIIISSDNRGTVDTTIFYFKDEELKLIYYHLCRCGATSVDDHVYEELLYDSNNLLFIRISQRIDYFDKGWTDESKSEISEQVIYLDYDGNCFKYFQPREAEGNRITVKDMLSAKPLIEKGCMYCPYNGNYGDEYLEKLKK